jgi:hypothetical protein
MSSRFAFAQVFSTVLVLAAFATSARADLVDDLLAGKPVSVSASEAPAEETASTEAARVVLSAEHQAVADDEHPLQVKLPGAPVAEVTETFKTGPATPVSLVPEPSAVGLASLALAYFFIFFRRRYA